jgi:hypothetical protein
MSWFGVKREDLECKGFACIWANYHFLGFYGPTTQVWLTVNGDILDFLLLLSVKNWRSALCVVEETTISYPFRIGLLYFVLQRCETIKFLLVRNPITTWEEDVLCWVTIVQWLNCLRLSANHIYIYVYALKSKELTLSESYGSRDVDTRCLNYV